jgi:hypothetical protein
MAHTPLAIRLMEDDPQALRVERHGYVNLINVVHAELQLIERMLDAPGSLRQTIFLAERASRAFREPAFIDGHERSLSSFRSVVREAVTTVRAAHDTDHQNNDVAEAVGILESVLADAGCRIHEVLARHKIKRPAATVDGQPAPLGLAYTLDRLQIELQLHSSREPEIDVRGNRVAVTFAAGSTTTALSALTEGLAPSELHERIANGVPLLRPFMEIYYFTIPDGTATIEIGNGEISVAAQLALI